MGLYVASLSFVISSRNLLNTFQVHTPPVSKKFFFCEECGKSSTRTVVDTPADISRGGHGLESTTPKKDSKTQKSAINYRICPMHLSARWFKMSRTPGGYRMSSTKTLPPSPVTSQTGDPSARLSLAIRNLDRLIIRVGHIGTLTNPSMSNTPRILVVSNETDATDIPVLDNQSAEC